MGNKAGIRISMLLGVLALLLQGLNIDLIAGNWKRQDEIARHQTEINRGAAVMQFSRRLREALTESAPGDERLRNLLHAEPN